MTTGTIIITGMHRSGTSFAANLLQQAGVNIGTSLLAGRADNPAGYYEDVDFLTFHQQALAQRGRDFLITTAFCFKPSPVEQEQAQRLIADRQGQPLWGWKEPRTTLFLDFWAELLPEAQFLFLYRHPLEVLHSLTRRGNFDYDLALANGMTSWVLYNTALKTFYEQYPDRCLLCHTYTIIDHYEQVGQLLAQKLGRDLHIDPAQSEAIYRAGALRRLPLGPAIDAVIEKLQPEAITLYRALDQLEDLLLAKEQEMAPSTETLPDNLVEIFERFSTPDLAEAREESLAWLLLLTFLDAPAIDALWQRHAKIAKSEKHELRRQLQRQVEAEYKAPLQRLEAKTARLEAEKVGLTNRLDNLQERTTRLVAEREKLQQAHQSLREKHRQQAEQLAQRHQEVQALSAAQAVLRRQIMDFEQRLNSQDLMTRHYLKLTAANIRNLFTNPNQGWQKLRRWIFHRLREKND